MTRAHSERTFVMKLSFLFLLIGTLVSCTLEVENSGAPMNRNPYDPFGTGGGPPHEEMVPYQPAPQGGFDPRKDYGQPSNRQLEKAPKAWQGNAKVISSNSVIGRLANLITPSFTEPGIYTVQFGITQGSPVPGGPAVYNPATDSIRCQAILAWTVDGNQIQRIFDIGNGVTISGVGSGASVSVQDVTATLSAASGTNGVEYLVTAQICRGTRAQFLTPVIAAGACSKLNNVVQAVPNPVGSFIINAGGGFQAVFPVPINAGVVSVKVMVKNATSPTTRPNFVSAAQATAGGTVYNNWVPVDDPAFVPLVPGTSTVTVTNQSAGDSVGVSLDWGIDG